MVIGLRSQRSGLAQRRERQSSHYSRAEIDRLLEQACTTLDANQRTPLYQQAQRTLMDDAVYCVLYLSPRGR